MAACAPSSHVLTGAARPPIPPSQVVVYTERPRAYEEIAVLNASSRNVLPWGGSPGTVKVVERLQAEAAKLGANGIILEGFDQDQSGSIGTGVSTESYSNHGTIGLGAGGSFGMVKTSGTARAVYIAPTP